MTDVKLKLQDNPRGALEPYITALQSESKMIRRRALVDMNLEIFQNEENADCDLTLIFPEVYAYVLKSFSDSSEACREASAELIGNFIAKLPLNDYYLTYILPVLVRRIGCPEIVEESEEIRLVLINLLRKILDKYKVSQLLSPFINDFTNILTKTVTDPFPKVKLEACECIIILTKILARDFHFQCESYVKPVLSNFSHQHFRVRVAAIRAIGAIVLAGNAKCFELSITPMAEKLFDESTQVRLQVTNEVGNWMLNYKDRYSFWHRMIPLLLTSLSDVMEDIRATATKLWDDIGQQYMDENEEDLKKKTDFLKDAPSHYPDNVTRPNLGCRTLVMSNIGKIVPAICKEMEGWQADARLRVAQLLCWLILCAEQGCTQHANTIVKAMLRGASDDDPRVVVEVKRSAELFGYFISPDTWWPLLEAEVDSWPALLVVANVVKGSRSEQVKARVMGELCKELADPDRCQTRKVKYQKYLLHTAESIMDLCGEACHSVAEELFIISFTVYAMPADGTVQFMALANLDKLRQREQCGSLVGLYARHIPRVLAGITSDALAWSVLSADRCLLDCALLHAGPALGDNLHLIAPLLKECLGTPKVDPEVRLRMFTTLSKVLLKRDDNFRNCDAEKLEAFLKIIVEDVLLPNLIWSAGRTAEAVRTAAAACLCAALQTPAHTPAGDGDQPDKEVKLFPTKESVEGFLERAVPAVVGIIDDNSHLTRAHALRAAVCLATLAHTAHAFTADVLHKIYYVVLKRLDDSNDQVRSYAVEAIQALFRLRPLQYDTAVYGAHVDAVYSALLIHLDDSDEGFRGAVLDALIQLSDIDPRLLMNKVKANIHLYRNKTAYEKLAAHIEKII